VNQYVSDPRMTQDVDLLCADPEVVAASLAQRLGELFHIATRVWELRPGKACRVFQIRSEGNRHLADLRLIEFALRRLAPKGATDLADLRRMLLAHPELRQEEGAVAHCIRVVGGGDDELQQWRALLAEPIVTDEESDEGY
jgi:hypothetical protein